VWVFGESIFVVADGRRRQRFRSPCAVKLQVFKFEVGSHGDSRIRSGELNRFRCLPLEAIAFRVSEPERFPKPMLGVER
jgi:hypothetical protein